MGQAAPGGRRVTTLCVGHQMELVQMHGQGAAAVIPLRRASLERA